ncbi:uncharacterized protein LOC128266621 [Drosophila gunungcola]|uniref:uncharacterized protein LOC128266621 n=1 Tax=Drosophila gunungcola TaxID=103775 RepID=UPI0022DF442A|nr:uncharacterized protein LOC128266621 [Drosophila gunungcola]
MDVTAASMMYPNPFYAPNYSGNQQPQSQQHQHQHQVSGLGIGSSGINAPPGVGSSGLSPRTAYSDLYRFEDGSGDASGSLMLGQDDDDLCAGEEASSPVASTSTAVGESLKGNAEELQLNLEEMAERSDMMTERGELQEDDDDEEEGDDEEEDDDEEEEQEENREVGAYISSMGGGSTSYMVFPRTAADFMPRLPLPRHSPYMIVGQEQYVIQPDTVFVLGMRLNVTKNDIITYFGRLGLIKMDEASQKPKIFVYKNKQTGRSKGEATITYVSPFSAQAAISCLSGAKFMGQVLTVLPAYLSTRQGRLRFNYPRELNSPERQRRQRALKWKPASDNWVCTLCRNSNFVWRSSCNRCQATKVSASGQGTSTGSGGADGARSWRPRKHDWPCGFCFNLNFWYREKCNRCHSPRSDEPPASGGDKPVPWELVLSTPPVE